MTTALAHPSPPRPARSHPHALRRWGVAIAVRVLAVVVVLWAVVTLTWFAQALLPGDRAAIIFNMRSGQSIEPSAAQLAPINSELGFDRSLLVQYWDYLSHVLRGDLGTSFAQREPVTKLIGEQIGPTAALTITSLLLAWLITIVLTVTTARRKRWISSTASSVEVATASLPQYWLGVVLLVVFAIKLQWFPVEGGTGLSGLVLPALTLAIPLAGFLGQVTRDEFERTLDQPFILSARARGMSDIEVRLRHALRHAILPAITLTGWAFGALLSAAVMAEIVFSRSGLGQLLVTAANHRDLPVVGGGVLLIAAVYIVVNRAVDLAYRRIDPRIEGAES